MTGSGRLGWSSMELRPGQLVRWTARTNFFVTAPAVVSGIEVPAWWTTSMVTRTLGLSPGDLARMEWCVTEEVQRQQAQAEAARRVLEDRREADRRGEDVVVIDSDEDMDV